MNEQQPVSDLIRHHNREQRAYFEATVKRTMLPTGSPYIRRQVGAVLRLAKIAPRGTALEVGCGMGRYTMEIARRGIAVEGLDLSPVLLERLRAFDGAQHSIPVHCGDVANPPAALHAQFDAVVGFFTLHHLHDLPRCFRGMARLLKPGGRMVFLEPNPLNPLYYVQILATPGMSWRAERGLLRLRPPIVSGAMQDAGLSRFTVSRFGFFPPAVANRRWGGRLEAALERVPVWRPLLPFQLFKAELA